MVARRLTPDVIPRHVECVIRTIEAVLRRLGTRSNRYYRQPEIVHAISFLLGVVGVPHHILDHFDRAYPESRRSWIVLESILGERDLHVEVSHGPDPQRLRAGYWVPTLVGIPGLIGVKNDLPPGALRDDRVAALCDGIRDVLSSEGMASLLGGDPDLGSANRVRAS